MSNISFLRSYDQSFVKVYDKAEGYDFSENSPFKVCQFSGMLEKYNAVKVGIKGWEFISQAELLNIFKQERDFGELVLNLFHSIRKAGNKAVHENKATLEKVIIHLQMAWHLAIAFHRGFSKDAFRDG